MASDVSAADLHRYFCEPYCPKCGFVAIYIDKTDSKTERCDNCDEVVKPGLHTRDPRTKVEGLEYSDHHKPHWSLRGQWLDDAHAADLLVQGVVKTCLQEHKKLTVAGLPEPDACVEVSITAFGTDRIDACTSTLPEAVSLAMHRSLDAEEQG